MSTKNTTTGSNSTSFQFDPGSMGAYQKNLGQYLPFAQSLYQNPFGNQMFQQENAIGQDQAASVGARNKSNVLANANAMGYGTNSGLMNSMLQRAGLDTGALQGQAFRGAVGNANQRAMTGLGISSAFQPLMTGSNSKFNQTQTTSGLGTWLPQVAGMALGAATAGFGAAGMGGAGGSMAGAGAGVGSTGAGMGGIMGGIGSILGGGSGYGYGAPTSGPKPNPFAFGG